MVRSAVRKVIWVGRATVFFVGLAVIVGAVFGVASLALAHTGSAGLLHLGHSNTSNAITRLVGSVAGPMLRLDNNSTGTGATALDLQVEPGKAPMTVNSSAKVANLNADQIDGQNSSSFAPLSGFDAAKVIDAAGPLPVQGTYTSNGGTLIISVAGSGFRASGNAQRNGKIGMKVTLDGNDAGWATVYTNERDSHKAFVNDFIVLRGVPAGEHTIRLEALYNFPLADCNTTNERDWHYCTTTDSNDVFKVTVVELPA